MLIRFIKNYTNILILEHNKITKIYTYDPDPDLVYSHPYEINTNQEYEEISTIDYWYRFEHLEISLNREEEKMFETKNMELIHLNKKEERGLEKKLKIITYD